MSGLRFDVAETTLGVAEHAGPHVPQRVAAAAERLGTNQLMRSPSINFTAAGSTVVDGAIEEE